VLGSANDGVQNYGAFCCHRQRLVCFGSTSRGTRSFLERPTEAELNAPREMISDPGQTRLLRPADVIMRVVTHIFSHQGQVLGDVPHYR
jgi:hypothetical protein